MENWIDTDKVTITEGSPETDFWLSGNINGQPDYTFSAKVYDVGSRYGIKGGRLSKLHVFHAGKEVIGYERGWGLRPRTAEQKEVLSIILQGFPEPPADGSGA